MAFSKKNFYLNTPSGDTILAEIFQEDEKVTILLGDNYRLDLDTESAMELADSLIFLTEEIDYDE